MTTFHIITLFPESFQSYLCASIIKRAQNKGLISIKYYNPRDFAMSSRKKEGLTYSEKRIDNRPYGGGPGMVIEALPVVRAIEKAVGKNAGIRFSYGEKRTGLKGSRKTSDKSLARKLKTKIIFFGPAGKQFTNKVAESFKKYTDIVLVCGHYEGIDARVKKIFPMVDISVGPYILTGGELPAMIVVDSITRRISGVLGDGLSLEESRVASSDVYTRPQIIEYKGKKYRVPNILLTGHHKKIDEWKIKRSK
jgi:tRNA (guanine37-N1)-methyltransferase